MCDGIVVDAHVIKCLTPELVAKSGTIYSLISWITSNCGIAISDPIKNHWENHCGTKEKNPYFWEWYFDELNNKHTIHFIPVERFPGPHWITLVAQYRIPNDVFIRAVIECAKSTSEPRYILADDILLYEPAAKATHATTQRNIKEDRSGSLCRHLQRRFSIILGTPSHCEIHFQVDQGPCQTRLQNTPGTPCPRTLL